MDYLSPDARPASPIDGRFHLQEEAGRGGMGIVWKAWDQAQQTWVAVKILHIMRASVAARFDREIRLLEGVGHPYVVRYHDQGQLPDGRRYLVMEWVEGETLAQRLHRGALSLDDAIELGRKLASALGAAHRRGIVHRDFKPSNVLLVGGDLQQPRLLDFGIARDVESQTHLTASEAILGTPGYVAPEQARSSRLADPRADIYALGVTLYESLTGCLPFGGATPIERLMAPLQSPPTPLRNLRSDASPYLERLFDRMLSRDPSQRPDDGDVAERWLAAASTSLHGDTPLETMASLPSLTPADFTPPGQIGSHAVPSGAFHADHTSMDMVDSLDIVPTRRNPPKVQRRPWAWLALAATMLVVGLGGGYWLSRDPDPSTTSSDERTSNDDGDRAPEDDGDLKETRRAKTPPPPKKRNGPSDEPYAMMPESSVCPGAHCELIPREMWDGVSVEDAFAFVEKRRKKLYPKSKFSMLVAPGLLEGRVEPRSLRANSLMVSYVDGERQLQAFFMMARLSFKRTDSAEDSTGHPPPHFASCPLAKAYRLTRGSLDERWQEKLLSVQATWLPGPSGHVPLWIIDDDWVDVNTCRIFKIR